MIVESIVLGLTVITVASLRFAYAMSNKPHLKERRKDLKKERDEWMRNVSHYEPNIRKEASRNIDRINQELLAIAKEETGSS